MKLTVTVYFTDLTYQRFDVDAQSEEGAWTQVINSALLFARQNGKAISMLQRHA